MVKKGAKSKKLNKLESLKAAIEEEENKSEENAVVEDQPKLVKKRKGKIFSGIPVTKILHFIAKNQNQNFV